MVDWATNDAETTPHFFMAFVAFFFMAGAAGAAAFFIAFFFAFVAAMVVWLCLLDNAQCVAAGL